MAQAVIPPGPQRPSPPSLPDSFGMVVRLAPTRAHPPPTSPRATTCCTPLLPRPSRRCLVAGRQGGAVGPLWVPGLTARRSMHGCPNTVRERALPTLLVNFTSRFLAELKSYVHPHHTITLRLPLPLAKVVGLSGMGLTVTLTCGGI